MKNLMIGILILLICGAIFWTITDAKNHIMSDTMAESRKEEPQPPEVSSSIGEENLEEEPNKEDNNSYEMMEEPPEKPDGETDLKSDIEKDFDSNKNEIPEKPEGEPNFEDKNENNFQPTLSYIYYIIFGVECLFLSGFLVYLIVSKFNKKTWKETFASGDKIIIYILSLIILMAALTYGCIQITENYFLQQSSERKDPIMEDVSNQSISYSSSKEMKEDADISSGDYSSNEIDQNAILVNGEVDVTLSNITVTKTGDSNGGDNTSFYGINSAILAKSGANLTLKNINVFTDATGANGVFSYGGSATTNNASSDGTVVTIRDSNITTTKDNSGGIMTTGGGIMNAYDLNISTSGISSAAIRTDRGGGTVNVDGGTYKTTGAGSPTIYSTADISVSNASLISTASEGIVIEGKNNVTMNHCTLTDSNTKLNGQSTTYKNIFLYQSMSGDAANGNSEFTAKDSSITTNYGDSFYVTNTTATISLENNTIINHDSDGNFLRVQKDSWGNSGKNGGDVTLIMTNQETLGNIVVDSISTLEMTMKSNSYYEGAINEEDSAKSIILTLDQNSKIKLTADSYVTTLIDEDTSYNNIDFNGYKLYVNHIAIN